jgi:hypothetical protein
VFITRRSIADLLRVLASMPFRRPRHASVISRSLPRAIVCRGALATLLGPLLAVGGCASRATTAPTAAPASIAAMPGEATSPIRWPVRTTGEHLDLWLHGFAMLTDDTTRVPLFRRGYRDSLVVVRNRRNVLTALDANRERLMRGLAASPSYVQAQFVPFSFTSWGDLRAAAERFLQVEGNPGRAGDRRMAEAVAMFAAAFPAAADREGLRLFVAALDDEEARFFGDARVQVGRERRDVVTAVDSLWQRRYRAAFQRYLVNTGQRTGELLLSVPLGGEGRTAIGVERQLVVAVPFPERPEDAIEAILVFAHEITGTLVGSVIADNTTPAEKRAGEADRLVAAGQVRAGALLLARIAPELSDAYARYYLAQAGRMDAWPDGAAATAAPATRDDARSAVRDAALAAVFPLPALMADAITRQLGIVLAGI